jgi:hypothetical protein
MDFLNIPSNVNPPSSLVFLNEDNGDLKGKMDKDFQKRNKK